MISIVLALTLGASAPADTLPVFADAQTEDLVRRAIEVSGSIPDDLRDYQARVHSQLHLTIAADTGQAAEAPVVVDETVSEVGWERAHQVEQRIVAHRMRARAAVPYTAASLIQTPWILPHLYGTTIDVFDVLAGETARVTTRSAVHPFGVMGPEVYRYEAGDTVRIRMMGSTLTVVPVYVRPRGETTRTLAVGTFYLDADRAAIAQARFMVRDPEMRARTYDVTTFWEVENALWADTYWLPSRQRFEMHIASPLLGGTIAARVVNEFVSLRPNTGWTLDSERPRVLVWDEDAEPDAFRAWEGEVAAGAGAFDVRDWDDLRVVARGDAGADPQGLRVGFMPERANHVIRYNRVEGLFLGGAARVEPADPDARTWSVYGTAGWAFSEGTPRGEIAADWRSVPAGRAEPDEWVWTARAAAYRRLPDTRTFRPTLEWDPILTMQAGLGGVDLRDYFDARGAALTFGTRQGPWRLRTGLRHERQAGVERNTQRYLFGAADPVDGFPPLSPAAAGTRTTLEGGVSHARGAGAWGIGRSFVAGLSGELGFGELDHDEIAALVSLRQPLGPFALALRIDAIQQWGVPAPQAIARFGELEGLGGYEPDQFGGTTAALGRGRFLIPLPPRDQRPLLRRGLWIIPPLRPHLVLVGEGGWSRVTEGEAADNLAAIGAVATEDGEGPAVRGAYGVGLSVFDDVLTVEHLWPTDDRPPRWRVGFVQWF